MADIKLKEAVRYDECSPTVCVQCRGKVFFGDGIRMGTLPPGHPKNPTKGPIFLEFKTKYCKDCGLVLGEPTRIIS